MTGGPATRGTIAVISGGSSGIGLACARLLAARGCHVILLARDLPRLQDATASMAPAGSAEAIVLDVTEAQACEAAIRDIVERHGHIDWLITCAGATEPGMFLDLDLAAHRRQMETNYFGTLNLALPVARIMNEQRSGRMVFVASAAAFVGIAGYSAYAPGKFAVRALGDVLRVELAPAGVSVSVAFPPDTDTPQLAAENLSKPEATKRITAGGGMLDAETVASSLLAGAQAGRFMLTPSLLIGAFGWFHSLYAPIFRALQIRILTRFARDDRR